ncbi:hypothetical protein Dimus_016098 [Dionaea muscipula]
MDEQYHHGRWKNWWEIFWVVKLAVGEQNQPWTNTIITGEQIRTGKNSQDSKSRAKQQQNKSGLERKYSRDDSKYSKILIYKPGKNCDLQSSCGNRRQHPKIGDDFLSNFVWLRFGLVQIGDFWFGLVQKFSQGE